MDALTALSLAGAIIQFVEFGSKILSSGNELYKSTTGALSGNDEVNLVTTDLLAIVKKLQHEGNFDKDFEQICDEARKVAQELLIRLESLKVKGKHRLWKSLRQAVQTALSTDEIDALRSRLAYLSKALETRVLMDLRFDVSFFVSAEKI